ncbi:hypothetical protein PLICRDRAFT_169690 [Plicaturopsis crispa FD-325 SS-3]|nr:hypothetical protein PLICRDRAFT_169690 [Plicaturopsis crispa FD-325 SS-3]
MKSNHVTTSYPSPYTPSSRHRSLVLNTQPAHTHAQHALHRPPSSSSHPLSISATHPAPSPRAVAAHLLSPPHNEPSVSAAWPPLLTLATSQALFSRIAFAFQAGGASQGAGTQGRAWESGEHTRTLTTPHPTRRLCQTQALRA